MDDERSELVETYKNPTKMF